MSTTGLADGPPTSCGPQIGDSGSGIHMVAAILAALYQRTHTGRGQRVTVAMQDSVLNLIRVKMRDQQRLAHGPLREYPNKEFADFVPRSGNASGGGQPGGALRCAPGGPNDYVYIIIQPHVWAPLAKLIGRPELVDDPAFATPEARLPHLEDVFGAVEAWTQGFTKFEVLDKLNAIDVPCGPIMSTKDLIEDESLRARGMIAEVEHPRARHVQDGRLSARAVGHAGGDHDVAAAGRAQRGDPARDRLGRRGRAGAARGGRALAWRSAATRSSVPARSARTSARRSRAAARTSR